MAANRTTSTGWNGARVRRRGAAFLLVLGLVFLGCASTSGAGSPTMPVVISPGDDVVAVIEAAPPASTFEFAAGLHRGVAFVARSGDTYIGQRGAVLSGAVVIEGFSIDGATWAAPVQRAGGPPTGECQVHRPACSLPEELFLDGRPLIRVLARSEVTSGTWMLDEVTGEVVVGDDPTGALVELSVTPGAISGTATGVTIIDLVMQHYANPAGRGVVHMGPGARDWRVEDCTVRDSHGVGVVIGEASTLEGCWLEGNGQQGAGGSGTGLLIERNVLVRNNRAGFSPGWSAGGAKFALTTGLTVVGNVVVANDGPGLWTDIDCVDTRYEGNWVQDNTQAGIHHEISGPALIIGNRVIGNGLGAVGWVWGAGIQVANSDGVEVRSNELQGNRHAIMGVDQERGAGARGQRDLRDLVVVGNRVVDSGQTGVAQDHGDHKVFARGHAFEGNHYAGASSWTWLDAERSWEGWRAFGHDMSGAYEPGA